MNALVGPPGVSLSLGALSRLMPLYVALDDQGRITSAGATLLKLLHEVAPVGQPFATVFELRRPNAPAEPQAMQGRLGERVHLCLRDDDTVIFRGIILPLQDGGLFINLSFGIAVVETVRRYGLTEADFAATDLAVEMLYLVEAKTAVMEELRHLNQRLQGGDGKDAFFRLGAPRSHHQDAQAGAADVLDSGEIEQEGRIALFAALEEGFNGKGELFARQMVYSSAD